MIAALLGIADKLLGLLEIKAQRKFAEKKMELQQRIRDEENKPLEGEDPLLVRSDAVLDNLKFELCNLIDGLATELKEQRAQGIA